MTAIEKGSKKAMMQRRQAVAMPGATRPMQARSVGACQAFSIVRIGSASWDARHSLVQTRSLHWEVVRPGGSQAGSVRAGLGLSGQCPQPDLATAGERHRDVSVSDRDSR